MKTTFRFIIAAMAAISVFSSCRKELLDEAAGNTTDGGRIISVQFDNSTKAFFDGLTPTFENNDKIRVSNATESEERQVSVDGSGNATFTTSLSGALTAIYPADAAVLGSGEGQPIVLPYFKVPASQDGKAIIAKAEIAEGSSDATFSGQTAVFEITPPSGATSITITSLRQIGTDGQRSGTAVAINDDTDGNSIYAITVAVPDGGKAYVSFVPGVNLTDLSFDAGATYGMKGIPMKDITARATSISEAVEAVNATAVNTKYTIDGNNWHPYVIIGTKKWATMNIGASSETDAGTYFAWGAVEKVYSALSSNTFTFLTDNPDSERYTGTSWSASDGFADCNTPYYDDNDYSSSKYKDNSSATLELSDDAANANWGGSWRMPTKSEFDALGAGNWVTSPGKGCTFGTSPNQIFLPAAGFGSGAGLEDVGDSGDYWSSSLYTDISSNAYYLYFCKGDEDTDSNRKYGQSVRALSDDVTPEPTPVLPEGALAGEFSVSATKKVHFSQGNLYYDGSKFNFEANQYDFRTYPGRGSCISGTYSSNSGTPTGHWGLFGWSTARTTYGISTSQDNVDYSGDFVDWGKNIGDGNTWRTLTKVEWTYLFNNHVNVWGQCNSVNGYFIAPDGYEGDATALTSAVTDWASAEAAGIVFLPAAGFRLGSSVSRIGEGYYWSSNAKDSDYAHSVYFDSGQVNKNSLGGRNDGFSVRLVTESVSPTPEPANTTGGIGSMERTDGAW